MSVRADHFPAGLEPEGGERTVAETSAGSIGATRLDAASAAALAAGLRARWAEFQAVPAETVLLELAAVHRALGTEIAFGRSPLVERIAETTGYPRSAVTSCLASLLARMTGPAMKGWLRDAGIRPAHLDPVDARAGRRVLGPALTVVIASGNIPGAALPSVVQALLLNEPVLAAAYARALAETPLGRFLVVTWWEGGDSPIEAEIARQAEAGIAYGSDETIAAWAQRITPPRRFLAYGHRAGIAVAARERLQRPGIARLAAALVRDIALFDQQGCLSPQVAYVEEGAPEGLEALVALLARELERADRRLPPRPQTPGEASAIHQYRAALEVRAVADPAVRIAHGGTDAGWTVAIDPHAEPGQVPLGRTAALRPVPSLEDLPAILAPCRGILGAACLAAPPERGPRLAELLAAAGANRVVRVGTAQTAVAPGLHDGANALAALARYVPLGGRY